MLKRKAQTQIISAVLITGIALGVVLVTYVWGVPLIQKSQTTNQIVSAENLMVSLEKAISDVVQTGVQKSITLTLMGGLEVSEEENSLNYVVITKGIGVSTEDWIPLNDENMFGVSGTLAEESVGLVGTNKAGVIIARSSIEVDSYKTTFRLAYRELDDLDSYEGYLVQIKESGNNIGTAGQHQIVIKRGEIEETGTSKTGGTLTVTPVMVTIA